MSRGEVERAAHAAAGAHSTLNTFATVVSILEGGHLYRPEAHKAAIQIIAICKRQQQRELRAYDAAIAAAIDAAKDKP